MNRESYISPEKAQINDLLSQNVVAQEIMDAQIQRAWEIIDASQGPNLVDPEHSQSFADATGVFDTVSEVVAERKELITDLRVSRVLHSLIQD